MVCEVHVDVTCSVISKFLNERVKNIIWTLLFVEMILAFLHIGRISVEQSSNWSFAL